MISKILLHSVRKNSATSLASTGLGLVALVTGLRFASLMRTKLAVHPTSHSLLLSSGLSTAAMGVCLVGNSVPYQYAYLWDEPCSLGRTNWGCNVEVGPTIVAFSALSAGLVLLGCHRALSAARTLFRLRLRRRRTGPGGRLALAAVPVSRPRSAAAQAATAALLVAAVWALAIASNLYRVVTLEAGSERLAFCHTAKGKMHVQQAASFVLNAVGLLCFLFATLLSRTQLYDFANNQVYFSLSERLELRHSVAMGESVGPVVGLSCVAHLAAAVWSFVSKEPLRCLPLPQRHLLAVAVTLVLHGLPAVGFCVLAETRLRRLWEGPREPADQAEAQRRHLHRLWTRPQDQAPPQNHFPLCCLHALRRKEAQASD